jgi:hypothetical protein
MVHALSSLHNKAFREKPELQIFAKCGALFNRFMRFAFR